MKANDINVGEHYAYTQYRNDRELLLWAREVEVLEVAIDAKGPHGPRTVYVRFVEGPEVIRGSYVSKTWVRPVTIVCTWHEAKARLAARQRDDKIEVAARDAARTAEEQARGEAESRFTMREVGATEWVISFDAEVRSSVVAPVVVATLNRAFFDEYRASRVLVELRDRFVKEAGEKARREVRGRLEVGRP